MRVLVVRCDRCGSKAVIQSSQEISPQYKRLYCCCRNPECGHTWAMDLTFSHTLSPSALDMPAELRQRISRGDRVEQRSLFESIRLNEKAPA